MKPKNKCVKFDNKTTESKIEMLEKKMLALIGGEREEAMMAYRKLLSASAEEPMYLMRS